MNVGNPFPWTKFSPPASDLDVVQSLAQQIELHARTRGDQPAAEYLSSTLTYRQLDYLGNRLARHLLARGLTSGEVIAIHLPNVPQYLIGLVAASKLGCPVTGVSPLLTAPEIVHQMADSGARALLTLDSLYRQAVMPVAEQLGGLRCAVVTGPIDFLPALKRTLAYGLKKLPRVEWKAIPGRATDPWLDAMKRRNDSNVRSPISANDTVLIQYTGGTTGKPKGAELSLSNLSANAAQASCFLGYQPTDTVASAFPLFHLAGLAISLMSLRSGARQLLIPNPRDIGHFVAQMQKFPPTMMGNVPSMYQMLMDHPDFTRIDFTNLRLAFSGAAPFAVEAIHKLESFVGKNKLCEVYGMTEASPLMTINPPARAKPGTVGIPVPGCNLKIMDVETGQIEMPTGEPGEITLCGPQVMKGYRNAREATAKTVRTRDGERWLYSGDVGYLDEEGYLTISDRAKDMLIVGGFKVFSVEVEGKLKELSFIEHAALIGVPDPVKPGNEVVHLFVQRSQAHLADDVAALQQKILEFCRANMAPYKIPKRIHFIAAMPLTAVGKLDKKLLRSQLMTELQENAA